MAPPFVLAGALAIVTAGILVYGRQLGFYFTDVDTFALISTSRFHSFDEFVSILTSPMMKGLLPNALFFRPFSSLTWGIDEHVWGLNPLGYHLTDLSIHLANALLVFGLVRGIAARGDAREPSRGDVEALVAGLLFAVHPVGVETVAAIARRPDLLFGFFSLLALHAARRYLAQERTRDLFAIATFCVLGLASKDSAVIVLALVGAYVFCFAEAADLQARLRFCFRVCLGPLVAVALYVGARAWVLGGLGGYESAFGFGLASVVKTSSLVFLCSAAIPGQLDSCTPAAGIGIALLLAGLGVLAAMRLLGDSNLEPRRRVGFAVLCLTLFFVLYIVTRTVALTRTIYALTPFLCMILAWGLVDGMKFLGDVVGRAERKPAWIRAVLATAFAALCGGIVVAAVRGQVLDEWRIMGELTREIVESIEDAIHDVAPGSIVYTVNIPFKASAHRPVLRDHPILDDYSLQGWADLAHPKRSLTIVGLTRTRIALDDPADLASVVSFAPDTARLDVFVGPHATVEPFEVERRWGRRHPLRVLERSSGDAGHTLALELLPEAFAREPVVFWVYAGDRVHLKRREAWKIEHAGKAAG